MLTNIYEPSYFLEHAEEIKEQLEMRDLTDTEHVVMHKALHRSVKIKGKERRAQMDDKLKSDTAAAKLLNRKVEVGCLGGTLTVTSEGQVEKFSLSDPATRDAVVQALGEKHYIAIIPVHPDYYESSGWMWEDQRYGEDSEVFGTYEEAVRKAALAVVRHE